MIEVENTQLEQVSLLFNEIEDSMVKACLQGYMGSAFVQTMNHPKAVMIVSGEYCFWGGDPNSQEAEYLVRNIFSVAKSQSLIAIYPESESDWEKLLLTMTQYNPVVVPRYGIVQKEYTFDNSVLQSYIDYIPEGFELVPFHENIYHQAMKEAWSQEFCETFSSAADYLERGFGFAVQKNGKLASGASTMTVYNGGTEIQVATHKKYKRNGLALACAAAMIQECVRRKIRPCWDAANLISKKMALKLGYEYRGEYNTTHISKPGNLC
ncbi:MAG: GNAT family N-acetyltransferase [Velocimicrobium sp.]